MRRWIQKTGQSAAPGGLLAVTFVIDLSERLLIADRHSEHVACAAGCDVRSAGEMFFAIDGPDVSVDQVSNQSTGYCPEPESWEVVERVLDRIGLNHPGLFTTVCIFRRCTHCGQRTSSRTAGSVARYVARNWTDSGTSSDVTNRNGWISCVPDSG